MSTRTKLSREELKSAIFLVARELVEEGGLPALTARAIANRVGCALGTTYNIFHNLDELIVLLNGETLDDLLAAFEAVTTGEGEAQIKAYAEAYVTFTHTHRHRWELLFEHRLPAGQRLPPWYFEKLAKPFRLVEKALAPYFAADQQDALVQSSRVLWAGLHGLCSLGPSGKLSLVADTDLRDLALRHVDLHLKGLRAA